MIFHLIPLLAAGLATLVWTASVGGIARLFDVTAPQGQVFYLLSKWFALVAVFLLTTQLLIMFSTYVFKSISKKHVLPLHRTTGVLLLISVAGHIACFFTATSIRAGHLNYQLFIPTFFNGYYTMMISVGLIAFVIMLVLVWLGLRGYRSLAGGLSLHKRLFPVFTLLAVVHSFAIGSEARNPPVLAAYAVTVLVSLGLLYSRWGGRSSSKHRHIPEETHTTQSTENNQ